MGIIVVKSSGGNKLNCSKSTAEATELGAKYSQS